MDQVVVRYRVDGATQPVYVAEADEISVQLFGYPPSPRGGRLVLITERHPDGITYR